jgi:hypothetical protein
MKKFTHKFKSGVLNHCQICYSKKIIKVFDFGYQPIADDLIEFKKNKEAKKFPLKINLCSKCVLLQIDYLCGDKKLYPKNYHYLPGISKQVIENFRDIANSVIKKYKPKKNDLIIDIGCNDGSLLNEFKKKGFKNLCGVEPTGTFKYAKKKGIFVYNSFFSEKISKKILKKFGKSKIILTTNVFAHTDQLGPFIKSTFKLMDDNSFFIIENHYLKTVVEKNQFDSFYHEHLRTYSLTSLKRLLSMYNLNLIYATQTSRYGGNIQAHFSKKYLKKPDKNVTNILRSEIKMNLNNKETYFKMFKKLEKLKMRIQKFLNKNKNRTIVGKSFPARASIQLNYFDKLQNHLKFIFEQPSSNKLNYFAPGTKIKIISSKTMHVHKPDIIIVFAWHMFDAIYKKWKKKLKTTKFVSLLPNLTIRN